MVKRTFVLFLCLLQVLALSLFSQQANASYDLNNAINRFEAEQISLAETLYSGSVCPDECCENAPIIQAHETEWKENLSDLLRHRHSSYRFITFESVTSVSFHFNVGFRVFSQNLPSFQLFGSTITLPDYYSFLHRLCPF
jgi:hypothetical protein